MGRGHILIVDDDEGVVPSLVRLLRHEGFTVSRAVDGAAALASIQEHPPDLMLLDIWLPGMDGIETLQALHGMDADIAVIMISGHGNIQTAVKATKLGAFDYIEKPFAPELLLHTIDQALRRSPAGTPPANAEILPSPVYKHNGAASAHKTPSRARLNARSVAAASQADPIRQASQRIRQRTLQQSTVLYGQGLQTGLKTGIILSPQPPHSGIVFRDITTGETLSATINFVESTDFSTSLRKGRVTVRTVEHLMSALHAYHISNLLIKISEEVPILDGSAADFCTCLEKAGIVEQTAWAEEFAVDRCYRIGGDQQGDKSIAVEPYNGFRVTYRLDYPQPLGVQEFTYEHRDGASYRDEVALARTFGFVKDVENMHDLGLIAGGRLNNVILLDGEKIVNSAQLHFPNECARHKVLDIIGDLYLLGKPLRGHVRANMTGHTENAALVRLLHNVALHQQR